MKTLKYRHVDGSVKCCVGLSSDELASQDYCASVIGELERKLERDEQINQETGAIEKRPVPVAAVVPKIPTDLEIASGDLRSLQEQVQKLAECVRFLSDKKGGG